MNKNLNDNGRGAITAPVGASGANAPFRLPHPYFTTFSLSFNGILIMVSVDPDELPMRKVEFANGKIGSSGLLISIVENEVGKQFLTER